MAFGAGASTELTLVIKGDGSVAVKQLGKVDKAIGKVSKSTVNWTQVASKASLAMMGIGAAAVGAFAISIKEAGKFEDVMKDVEIQSGATAREMEEIKKVALSKEMMRLGKSGAEAGKIFKRLASEGLNVAKMKKILIPLTHSVINLGQEEGETTKLLLNLLNQYSIATEDASRVSDAFANAIGNTSYQGDELAQVMSAVGNAASYAGLSLEDTVVITDQVIKSVGDASKTGRGFARLIASIQAPTKKMNDEFAKTSVTADQLADALKDPIKFTELMQQAMEEGLNVFAAFDQVAARTALTLRKASTEDMKIAQEAMKQVGTGAANATEKMETWKGSLEILGAELDNLKESIGKDAINALSKYIHILVEAAEDTEGLAGSINTGLKVALAVGLVGGATQAILIVARLIEAFRVLRTTAIGAQAAVAGPWVLLGAGVVAAGAAVSLSVQDQAAAAKERTRRLGEALAGERPISRIDPKTGKDREMFIGQGATAPSWQERIGGAIRGGLKGLLEQGFGERFDLQVADMSDEFLQLQEAVRLAQKEIEFDKKGNILPKWQAFAGILQTVQAQLSDTKREAEGFIGMEKGIESLAATGEVGGKTVDRLLKGLMPYLRAVDERIELERELAGIIQSAPSPPITETSMWADTVAELGYAMASGILSEEDFTNAQDKLRFAVEQGMLALEEQSIAFTILQVQASEAARALEEEQAALLKALMPEPAELPEAAIGGMRMGLPTTISPGIDTAAAELKELYAVLDDMSFEETMEAFFGATKDMEDEANRLAQSMERAFTNAITQGIMSGELSFDSLVKMIESTVINVAVNALMSGSSVAGALSSIPVIGPIVDLFGGLFDNPVNDAWARYEGARFARFFGEGIDQEGMRSSGGVTTQRQGEQTINNMQSYNIQTIAQDPRETVRALARETERDAW